MFSTILGSNNTNHHRKVKSRIWIQNLEEVKKDSVGTLEQSMGARNE
jgi:hypothetical protein